MADILTALREGEALPATGTAHGHVRLKDGRLARIAMGILGSASMVVLFGMSLPAAWDYVSFMKVEKSSYMNIRFDVLFSIYILFSVAVIARHLWNLGQLLRGKDPASAETQASP